MNWMGLGFSFGAKDKGLSKAQTAAHKGFVQINDQLDVMVDKAAKASAVVKVLSSSLSTLSDSAKQTSDVGKAFAGMAAQAKGVDKLSTATDSLGGALKGTQKLSQAATDKLEAMGVEVKGLEGKIAGLEKALASKGKVDKTQIKILGTLQDTLSITKKGFDAVRQSVVLLRDILRQSKLQTLIQSIGLSKLIDMANDLPGALSQGMNLTTGLESQMTQMSKTTRATAANLGFMGDELTQVSRKAASMAYGLNLSEETAVKSIATWKDAEGSLRALGFTSETQLAKFSEAFGVGSDVIAYQSDRMRTELGFSEDQIKSLVSSTVAMGQATRDVSGGFNELSGLLDLTSTRIALGDSADEAHRFAKETQALAAGFYATNQDAGKSRQLAMDWASQMTEARKGFQDMFTGVQSDLPEFFKAVSIAEGDVQGALDTMRQGPLEFAMSMDKMIRDAGGWGKLSKEEADLYRAQMSKAFGGNDQMMNTFIAMMDKGGAKTQEFMKEIMGASRDLGKMGDEAYRTGITLQESFDRSKQAFEVGFRKIARKEARAFVRDTGKEFKKFNKNMKEIVDEGGPMAALISKMSEAHQLGMMAFIPKTLRPMTTVFGEMASQMAPVATGLGSLGLRFKHLLNPMTLVVGGALAMGVAFKVSENSLKNSVEALADSPKALRTEEKALGKLSEQLANTAEGTEAYTKLKREYDLRAANVKSAKAIGVEEKALKGLQKQLKKTKLGTGEYYALQAQVVVKEGKLSAERKAVAMRAREESKARIKDMAQRAVEMVTGVVQAMPAIIRGVVDTLKDVGPEILDGFREIFQALSDNQGVFLALFESVGDVIEDVFDALGKLPWDNIFETVAKTAGDFLFSVLFGNEDKSSQAVRVGDAIHGILMKAISGIGSALSALASMWWDKFVSAVSEGSFTDRLKKAAGLIGMTFMGALLLPAGLRTMLFKGLKLLFVDVLGGLAKALGPAFSKLAGGLTGAFRGKGPQISGDLMADLSGAGGMPGAGPAAAARQPGLARRIAGADVMQLPGFKQVGNQARSLGNTARMGGAAVYGRGRSLVSSGAGRLSAGAGRLANTRVGGAMARGGQALRRGGSRIAGAAQRGGQAVARGGQALARGGGAVARGAGAAAKSVPILGAVIEAGFALKNVSDRWDEAADSNRRASMVSEEAGKAMVGYATFGISHMVGFDEAVGPAQDSLVDFMKEARQSTGAMVALTAAVPGLSSALALLPEQATDAQKAAIQQRQFGAMQLTTMAGNLATKTIQKTGGDKATLKGEQAGAVNVMDAAAALEKLAKIQSSKMTPALEAQKDILLKQVQSLTNIGEEDMARIGALKSGSDYQKLSNAMLIQYSAKVKGARGEHDNITRAAVNLDDSLQSSVLGMQKLEGYSAAVKDQLEGAANAQRDLNSKLQGPVKETAKQVDSTMERIRKMDAILADPMASKTTKKKAKAALLQARGEAAKNQIELQMANISALSQGVQVDQTEIGQRAAGFMALGTGAESKLNVGGSTKQQLKQVSAMEKALAKGGAGALKSGDILTESEINSVFSMVDSKVQERLLSLQDKVNTAVAENDTKVQGAIVDYRAAMDIAGTSSGVEFTDAIMRTVIENKDKVQEGITSAMSGVGGLQLTGTDMSVFTPEDVVKNRERLQKMWAADPTGAKLETSFGLTPLTPEDFAAAFAVATDPAVKEQLQKQLQFGTLIDPENLMQISGMGEAFFGAGEKSQEMMEAAAVGLKGYVDENTASMLNSLWQVEGETKRLFGNSLSDYPIEDFKKSTGAVTNFVDMSITELGRFEVALKGTFNDSWLHILNLTDIAVTAIREDTDAALSDLGSLSNMLDLATTARQEVQAAAVLSAPPVLGSEAEDAVFQATHWPRWYTEDYRARMISLTAAVTSLKGAMQGNTPKGGRGATSSAGARSKFSSKGEDFAGNQGSSTGAGSPVHK